MGEAVLAPGGLTWRLDQSLRWPGAGRQGAEQQPSGAISRGGIDQYGSLAEPQEIPSDWRGQIGLGKHINDLANQTQGQGLKNLPLSTAAREDKQP